MRVHHLFGLVTGMARPCFRDLLGISSSHLQPKLESFACLHTLEGSAPLVTEAPSARHFAFPDSITVDRKSVSKPALHRTEN